MFYNLADEFNVRGDALDILFDKVWHECFDLQVKTNLCVVTELLRSGRGWCVCVFAYVLNGRHPQFLLSQLIISFFLSLFISIFFV